MTYNFIWPAARRKPARTRQPLLEGSSHMNFLTIGMLVVLAALIFFMFRSSRKRQRDAASLQEKVVPGAEVMTNFGLFGTVKSIDTEDNKLQLEIAPGTIVTLHRQTVTRVVEAAEPDEAEHDQLDEAETTPELNVDHAIHSDSPTYGERIDEKKNPGSGAAQ
jgi:preprotein translocase subunit YajC